MTLRNDDAPNIAIFCDYENVAIGVRDANYDSFDIHLVLDQHGLVKLIDINNFRRLVRNDELEAALPPELDVEEYALGRKDIRRLLPPEFLDDLGNPICDLSLAALQTLEMRGLGRDPGSLDKDPFYAPLHHERRRLALALLRSDMA